MNLTFQTISTTERAGSHCLVQRAIIPVDYKRFWIIWKTTTDPRLKDNLMLRKEDGRWAAYRTIPADGIDIGPLPMPYIPKKVDRLLPYQPDAVSRLTRSLIDRGCAVDGSDTGLGKTYAALGSCRELQLSPAVICRKAGIAGWKRACDYMGIKPLFIVNWEYARTGKFPYCTREHHAYEPRWIYTWHTQSDACLIFDECHMGCNDGTLNNQLWMASKGKPSLFLSATLADRPERLASLIELLGVCDRESYRQWLIKRGYFYNQHNELESLSSVQDMIEVNKILYPKFGVRLSYQDEAVKKYFPECVYQIEIVTLDRPEIQNRAYEKLLQKVAAYREMGNRQADILVAELRYRQSAELLKAPILAEYAKEYVYEGKSVCIFVNFRETLAALADILKTRSLVFGNQEAMKINRENVIANFQSNTERIIICMVDAGGQSIDLHDLEGGHQRISLICPTYNPISLKQVLGRTYRAGSRSVPVMKLIYAADTVEEKVAESVRAKLSNIDALNRGDLAQDVFE